MIILQNHYRLKKYQNHFLNKYSQVNCTLIEGAIILSSDIRAQVRASETIGPPSFFLIHKSYQTTSLACFASVFHKPCKGNNGRDTILWQVTVMIGITTGYDAKAEKRWWKLTRNSIKWTDHKNSLLERKSYFNQLTCLKISMLMSR